MEVRGALISYLIKGTRNLSLKYIEKNLTKHRFLERLSVVSQDLSSEIEENLSAKELQQYVDGAVAKLPGKMKEIYLLSRDEQLTHREISQRLGIAEGTVKKQISNALKIISTHIKPNLSGAIYVILMHISKA
ncbi:sigma-70 family RNA polymerase sigma factor [Pedobacter nutrimenti]|uniref:sigma-70 family RNA polymerase sigma factor n=1 Tax=Pedobacter nutrimenti TaxID=1241337 RepID=UPI00292EA36C|nr:sigma-70 family RNA polymerase sigma factor [Pedobacter nutrimenti]